MSEEPHGRRHDLAIGEWCFLDIAHHPEEAEAEDQDLNRDAEAINHLVTFILELAERQPNQELRVVVGCPARASTEDRQALADAVSGLVDYVLIASEPFLVAYGLDLFNNALIIDIGAGTLDLCRMHGTIPSEEDQRTLVKAGNFVDSRLHMLLQEKIKDSPITLENARRIKEQYAFVSSQKEVIYVDFQVNGKPKTYDVTEGSEGSLRKCHARSDRERPGTDRDVRSGVPSTICGRTYCSPEAAVRFAPLRKRYVRT